MRLPRGTRVVVVASAVVLLRAAQAPSQQATSPLHRDQILKLVQNYVPGPRMAELVKQRGIDFVPSENYLAILQKAGAEPVLLEALRAASVVKPKAIAASSAQPAAGQIEPRGAQDHLDAGRRWWCRTSSRML